jgi:hypothetical protein
VSAFLWLLSCTVAPVPHSEPVPSTVEHVPQTVVQHLAESPCDAGDEVWVQRTLPLLWGRQAHGAAEVRLWAEVARHYGRDEAVRAMARSDAYLDTWSTWMMDDLGVDRDGYRRARDCFDDTLLDSHDGSLAEWMRTAPADQAHPVRFTMLDLLHDALVADDVSGVYRAWMLGRMSRPPVPCPNASDEDNERDARRDFGETFFATWLGTDLECLACHNHEWSVTDHPDPWLDASWPLDGHVETALLGSPGGADASSTYAVFRSIAGGIASPTPWGWDPACGQLNHPDASEGDPLGQDHTFFVESLGAADSAYSLQQLFADGVATLRTDGFQVAPDGSVDPHAAFAYRLASTLADDVWTTATGASLVLSHGLPRNAAQHDRLQALTDVFASSGFALTELLVAVTTDPLYNAGTPGSCESAPYPLPPVFDPFAVHDDDPERWGNAASDRVRRHRARVLLRSIDDALGWPSPDPFDLDEDTRVLWAALGAYISQQDRGFEGTSFQALLELESAYDVCRPPPGVTDHIDALVASGGTLQSAVVALRDRLTRDGTLQPGEDELLADLLQHPLQTEIGELPVDEADDALRAYCHVLLLSPRVQLAGDLGGIGEVPERAWGLDEDCAVATDLLAALGHDATCVGGRLVP